MNRIFEPGATLGVFGGGQLGRMFTVAARRLGYRVHVLVPDSDTPAGQLADKEVHAAYDDIDAATAFVKGVDVVTFEFENIPRETIDLAEQFVPVRPAGNVLATTQNRNIEKNWLKDHGFPLPKYAVVESLEQLESALAHTGTPAVLKTAAWGYDGKGQSKIMKTGDAAAAWKATGEQTCVLEQFVNFECELSVVVARGEDHSVKTYGPMRNDHVNHILDVSSCPAGLAPEAEKAACELAREIAAALDVIGVCCIEMFLTHEGDLLVNEIAPRPHNSGHLTVDAHTTCQFEQQVRSICGLPLGAADPLRPAACANLLGDLWKNGEPAWATMLALDEVKLHLYSKAAARPGRKMGHITALADSPDKAIQRVLEARALLPR